MQSVNSEGSIQMTASSVIKSPYKTQLDNFIIRDSTAQERNTFSKEVEAFIKTQSK
jgi:hypothetical protein